MDFSLSDEQRLIRDTVRDFARNEVAPVAEELDRTKSFPYELVAKMGELGLMGIPFAEEYGGGGADTLAYVLAVEELARIDSSVGITLAAHTSLGTMPIYLWGTTEQKEEWLPELCAGRKLAAFGLTEPEAGSDAGATRTRAKLDDGEWVIDGSKQFITNAGTDISACVTITAVTDSGNGRPEISNIIVPNGTPGYVVGEPYRKMGWNASDTRPLTFEGARVPEGNLLGRRGDGFKNFLHILDGGRIGVSAMGSAWRRARSTRRSPTRTSARRSARRSASSRRSRRRSPTSRRSSRRRASSPTAARCKRTRASRSRSPPHRRSSSPAASPSAPPRRRCRSTAATATSRSTRSAASTATRRSSPSARAPTRSSRW